MGDATAIFTKLIKYPYEFEINNKLQLASIDGVKIADTDSNGNTGSNNAEYNKNIYDEWTTWLHIANIENPEQYNGQNILENDQLLDKLFSSNEANEYMLNSKYFILPMVLNSDKAINKILADSDLINTIMSNEYVRQNEEVIGKFDEYAFKVPASSSVTNKMLCSTSYYSNTVRYAFDSQLTSTFENGVGNWAAVGSQTDSYIGYNFEEPTKLYKFKLNAGCNYSTVMKYSFFLQGLKEDGTWENIGDEYIIQFQTAGNFITNDYLVDTDKEYYGYRIKNSYSTTGNGYQYWCVSGHSCFGVGELQFYCTK